MAIATCVFTCKSWFCMSRMTCLIIFSGCSARSIRSLRFALTKVDTRSSNAIWDSFHDHVRTAAPPSIHSGQALGCPAERSSAAHCRFLAPFGTTICSPARARRPRLHRKPRRVHCPPPQNLLPYSRTFARRRQSIRRLRAFVTNRSDLGKQLAHAHARKRFKERGHLRRHLGAVAGDLVHSRRIAVAGRNNGYLTDIGTRHR